MSERTYKLRVLHGRARSKSNGAAGPYAYALAVPPAIGDLVPAGVEFTCEATDDGILYRPVRPTLPINQRIGWPRWMDQAGEATA